MPPASEATFEVPLAGPPGLGTSLLVPPPPGLELPDDDDEEGSDTAQAAAIAAFWCLPSSIELKQGNEVLEVLSRILRLALPASSPLPRWPPSLHVPYHWTRRLNFLAVAVGINSAMKKSRGGPGGQSGQGDPTAEAFSSKTSGAIAPAQ